MSAVRRWRALAALLLVLSACAAQAPPRVTPAALPRRYEGRSADLASLVAIWTTTGSGAKGALVVRAQGR